MRSGAVLLAAFIAVVAASVVVGLFLIGSPGEQRLRRLDDARVTDLQNLSGEIAAYVRTHHALPPTVEAASRPGYAIPRDPVSRQPYGYDVIDATHYRLCAVFQTAAADVAVYEGREAHHGKGQTCFTYEVKLP
ncbi:MAG: hypothetical protein KGK10_10245 [Rhodospirillales bacterium]|jgi:hypothetical protein|nr:hypothetical protein [Rhodospirillales bacterium]